MLWYADTEKVTEKDTTKMGTMLGEEVESTHGVTTHTEERALALLGAGISMDATASACGVSVSRISQLMGSEDFAAKVAQLRYEALQKHNKQDGELDSLEELLTTQFRASIPLIMRPMEILKGLQVINAAKRRGAERVEIIDSKAQVVNITLPSVIINNFTSAALITNIHNQVVSINSETGDTDLTTMQSCTLLNQHKKEENKRLELAVSTEILNETLESNSLGERAGDRKQKADRRPENI